ncbi:hypothetical protein F4604DRAFT_1594040, partial [Suillus subluteus]
HWHGIYQNGTSYADGTSTVTQCPIAQNQSYLQSFSAQNQAGMYHPPPSSKLFIPSPSHFGTIDNLLRLQKIHTLIQVLVSYVVPRDKYRPDDF